MYLTVMQRLIENSQDAPGGCRLWTGKLNTPGRTMGVISVHSTTKLVHRVAFEEYYWKPQSVVVQTCGNRLCIARDHLREQYPNRNPHCPTCTCAPSAPKNNRMCVESNPKPISDLASVVA